ncbi:MAG: DNA repair protein RecN [Clostridiales bacterium]|nr:DNA repair protein RecN [Clostridiales bacterium]
MLSNLHIENFAVIERVDVRFGEGFNVLTGETGAGKSILIDSIGAVLGGRVSKDCVRAGSSRAVVTAAFLAPAADAWCEENGIEPEQTLILQRQITADGRSSCRVNGVPVSVAQLRGLGACLLDIHGQNDGRQLMDESRHLAYLDAFAGVQQETDAYQAAWHAYQETAAQIRRLTMDELEKERLQRSLSAEAAELEAAGLRQGEEEELTARRDLLHNAERLTEWINQAYEALSGGDPSGAGLAADAARCVTRAAAWAPELEQTAAQIQEAACTLEDAAEQLRDLLGTLDFSPQEYDALETRISTLRRLQKKYRTDETGLIERLADAKRQLDEIAFSEDRLTRLEKELAARRAAAARAAAALTARRRAAAAELEGRIARELRDLSMPSARFLVELEPIEDEPGFGPTGADTVRFLMSANAGMAPGRISKIASGGELSRIMLAIKSVFAAHDPVGTMVFDEIDTGVSGVAAQRVGEKIAQLAAQRQILCITHLPQIAAMADWHFYIEKAECGGMAKTSVTLLGQDGRCRELARLHGGDRVTQTTLASAQEQLRAAEEWKRKRNPGG